MQPTANFDASKLARSLLRRSRQGALATLMPESGDPYCSLVNVASHADASPILLISRLALHTKNILGDGRIADAGRARRRRSAGGRANHAGGPGRRGHRGGCEVLRRRYLNAHPSAEAFVDFKDFSFFRIAPSGLHLVAGFGRIIDLKPEQFLTGIGDAADLLEAEQGAVEHMNEDHRDAMNLYATKCWGPKRRLALHRLRPRRHGHAGRQRDAAAGFSGTGHSAMALRKMLVRLAGEARAKGWRTISAAATGRLDQAQRDDSGLQLRRAIAASAVPRTSALRRSALKFLIVQRNFGHATMVAQPRRQNYEKRRSKR